MAYGWAQLAFVEKWRLSAVRGRLVGMHRPADRTFFDIRLRPGEGNVGTIAGSLDVQLQDAGDIIREKRFGLLDTVSVVIRVVAEQAAPRSEAGRPVSRQSFLKGEVFQGSLAAAEDDICVLDVGFPVIVQMPEPGAGLHVGDQVEVSVAETPKGFLVV